MAERTHARFFKRPERSILWLTVAMVGCWVGACALSLAIGFNWIV